MLSGPLKLVVHKALCILDRPRYKVNFAAHLFQFVRGLFHLSFQVHGYPELSLEGHCQFDMINPIKVAKAFVDGGMAQPR